MAAIMKYNVNKCFRKDQKTERNFAANCYRALFWSKDADEMDHILYSMFVFALADNNTILSR
jgi:hypothetical protein